MISLIYLTLVVGCFVCCSGEVQKEVEPTSPAPKDDSPPSPTDIGHFRFGNPFYIYSSAGDGNSKNVFVYKPQNSGETNHIGTGEEERRPLFYLTFKVPPGSEPQPPSDSEQLIEIRKKRDADVKDQDIPEESKVGKLRRKRTYCHKCGGRGYGGYGGSYAVYVPVSVPVTYQVVPVYSYYPSYGGGGGRGCNTCGKGHGGGGYGGSYSYSSSSAQSSSGSWGYGK